MNLVYWTSNVSCNLFRGVADKARWPFDFDLSSGCGLGRRYWSLFLWRLLGGPKLAPSISPSKTWTGAAGGLFCSLLVVLIFPCAGRVIF